MLDRSVTRRWRRSEARWQSRASRAGRVMAVPGRADREPAVPTRAEAVLGRTETAVVAESRVRQIEVTRGRVIATDDGPVGRPQTRAVPAIGTDLAEGPPDVREMHLLVVVTVGPQRAQIVLRQGVPLLEPVDATERVPGTAGSMTVVGPQRKSVESATGAPIQAGPGKGTSVAAGAMIAAGLAMTGVGTVKPRRRPGVRRCQPRLTDPSWNDSSSPSFAPCPTPWPTRLPATL